MKKIALLLSVVFVGMAACQTMKQPEPQSPYHPYGTNTDAKDGYIDVQISETVYEITYKGAYKSNERFARKMALLRAAEIGFMINKPYFSLERFNPPINLSATDSAEVSLNDLVDEGSEKIEKATTGVTSSEVWPEVTIKAYYTTSPCESCLSVIALINDARKNEYIR